jgi:hypothetical protein
MKDLHDFKPEQQIWINTTTNRFNPVSAIITDEAAFDKDKFDKEPPLSSRDYIPVKFQKSTGYVFYKHVYSSIKEAFEAWKHVKLKEIEAEQKYINEIESKYNLK